MKDDQSGGLLALVSKVVGVEGGPSFDFSRFISGVFVRHSDEELEEFLCQGDGVPSDRISREWPMPWVFSRVLVFGALAALFAWLCGVFSPGNLRVVPLQMFAYTALIPLGVTVLLFELNVCRSISVYTALKVFLAGGVIAFVASAFVYDVMANTAVSKALGQSEAGIGRRSFRRSPGSWVWSVRRNSMPGVSSERSSPGMTSRSGPKYSIADI